MIPFHATTPSGPGRLCPGAWRLRTATLSALSVAVLLSQLVDPQRACAEANARPNIVLIMADDI